MCLNSHMATLSPACQAAVQAALPPPPAAAAPPPAAPPPPKAVAAPPPPTSGRRGCASAAASRPASGCRATPPKAKAKANQRLKPRPSHQNRLRRRRNRPPPPPAPPAAPVVTSALVARIEALPLRKRLALARACDRDRDANCKLVKRGTSLIVCLVEHTPALSPHCKDVLTATLN